MLPCRREREEVFYLDLSFSLFPVVLTPSLSSLILLLLLPPPPSLLFRFPVAGAEICFCQCTSPVLTFFFFFSFGDFIMFSW